MLPVSEGDSNRPMLPVSEGDSHSILLYICAAQESILPLVFSSGTLTVKRLERQFDLKVSGAIARA